MSLRGVLLAIGIIMILAVLTPRPVAQDSSAQAVALNEIEAVTVAIEAARATDPSGSSFLAGTSRYRAQPCLVKRLYPRPCTSKWPWCSMPLRENFS